MGRHLGFAPNLAVSQTAVRTTTLMTPLNQGPGSSALRRPPGKWSGGLLANGSISGLGASSQNRTDVFGLRNRRSAIELWRRKEIGGGTIDYPQAASRWFVQPCHRQSRVAGFDDRRASILHRSAGDLVSIDALTGLRSQPVDQLTTPERLNLTRSDCRPTQASQPGYRALRLS